MISVDAFAAALLENVAPLQLVISGHIIRSEDNRVAVQMARYEFRTLRIAAEPGTVSAATPQKLPADSKHTLSTSQGKVR